eukprot:2693356-Karenia_brevis.AAC.1
MFGMMPTRAALQLLMDKTGQTLEACPSTIAVDLLNLVIELFLFFPRSLYDDDGVDGYDESSNNYTSSLDPNMLDL